MTNNIRLGLLLLFVSYAPVARASPPQATSLPAKAKTLSAQKARILKKLQTRIYGNRRTRRKLPTQKIRNLREALKQTGRKSIHKSSAHKSRGTRGLRGHGVSGTSLKSLKIRRFRPVRQFRRIWRVVKRRLFPASRVKQHMTPAQYKRLLRQIRHVRSVREFALVVNAFLAKLRVSHTRLFTPEELGYHFLRSLFSGRKQRPHRIWHIGVQLAQRKGRYVVRAVLNSYPAQQAGLRRGDVILLANGKPFQPVGSFRAAKGKTVTLLVQRNQRRISLSVKPVYEVLTDSFIQATRRSVRILRVAGKKVGYLRLWSMTSPRKINRYLDQIKRNQLQGADGLILDMRDGYGGRWYGFRHHFFLSSQDYFQTRAQSRRRQGYWRRETNPWERRLRKEMFLFRVGLSMLPMLQHSRTSRRISPPSWIKPPSWTKDYSPVFTGPMVVLINRGTRSAKEALVFQLRKSRRAWIVGTRTTGAFTAAWAPIQTSRYLLYVGTVGLWLDQKVLEGRGVGPDIQVSYPLDRSIDKDPQLQKGIATMRRCLQGQSQWCRYDATMIKVFQRLQRSVHPSPSSRPVSRPSSHRE